MNSTNQRTAGYRAPAPALIVAAVALLLFGYSCTTTDRAVQQQSTDRIMAENSQMKKRIPLIERENDVLTQENFQYKARLHEAMGRIDHLLADLSYLDDKFNTYVASSETQIQFLERNYSLLETASLQQIAELSSRYEELESTRQQENKDLNARLAEQNSAFAKEKDILERNLHVREKELASLIITNGELLKQLEAVSGQLAKAQTQRNQIEKDLQTVREINAELLQRLQNVNPRAE